MIRWVSAAVMASCVAAGLEAQSTRDTLRMAHQAFDDFNEPVARQLFRQGLSPNGGPMDSLWALGLHRFIQMQLSEGSEDEALQWLRWAIRRNPQLAVDSAFPPVVVSTFESVRSIVTQQMLPSSIVSSSWDWTPAADPSALGRLTLASADTLSEVTAVVVGTGVIPPEGLSLPPGTYRVTTTAPGYESAEIFREVLPGVATHIRVRLRDLNPGLLYVGSDPWGTVYVDSDRIGYTMLSAHPLTTGQHQIRIVRPGYVPFDTTITIARDQRLRLGTIPLVPTGNP